MNGFEFIKKVKELKPIVKVFFMTTFEIDVDELSNVLPSVKVDEFIQKPVTLEKIGNLILTHIPLLKDS
jgi:two-component SAPR family response regulator